MDLPRKAGADGLLPSEAQAPPVTERRPAEGYSGANANQPKRFLECDASQRADVMATIATATTQLNLRA
jgi:hypothetical protein